jgi:hypothetical protein
MRKKIRIKRFLEDEDRFEALESAVALDIPLYVYIKPRQYKIQHLKEAAICSEDQSISLPFGGESNRETILPLDYYQVCPKVLTLIILREISNFGVVQDATFLGKSIKGDFNTINSFPLVKILKDTINSNEDTITLMVENYDIKNLYINDVDTVQFTASLKKSDESNPYSSLKSPFPDKQVPVFKSTQTPSHLKKYTESSAGDNLKLTHEALVEFLISTIESDFKNNHLKEGSTLRTLLSNDGKLFDTRLAELLNENAKSYFDNQVGFKTESIRKKIAAIRRNFN